MASKNAAAEFDVFQRWDFVEKPPDLYMIVDRLGHCVQVSANCYEILGFEPNELIGRSALDLIISEDRDKARDIMCITRRGHFMHTFESRSTHRDNYIVSVEWTVHMERSATSRRLRC